MAGRSLAFGVKAASSFQADPLGSMTYAGAELQVTVTVSIVSSPGVEA